MDETTIWLGPQHPSIHGFALQVKIVGDYVVELNMRIGMFHRSAEKVLEFRTFKQGSLIFERISMLEAMALPLPYVMAVEQIADIEVPERAQYIRTIVAELSRIHSLLFWFGSYGAELGQFYTMMWPFRDREYILDIFEALTGSRHTPSYLLPGGVRWNFNDKIIKMIHKNLGRIQRRMETYWRIFPGSPTFKLRTQDIGVLSREDAIRLGVSGPNLKGAKARADLRKDDPYLVYNTLDFEIPTGPDGDALSRMIARIREIETSLDLILNQLLPNLPEGDFLVKKFPARLPAGEAYGRIEGVRGILGAYVRTEEKSPMPYRVKIRSPSFNHMYAFKHIVESQETRFADIVAIMGSLDAYTAEFDR